MKRLHITDEEKLKLQAEYGIYKSMNLKLSMTRGVPCPEQLDLSNPMLTIVGENSGFSAKGIGDIRNYGGEPGLLGIYEARKLFAEIFRSAPEEVAVMNNASLNIMYDMMVKAMLFGVPGGDKPWGKYEKIKFLCPCPGYDRHFSICESLGIEMLPVRMTPCGPDMDEVEKLCENDDTVKGIWCVPKYSNPEGVTYSDETVMRFAGLKPAAKDFRIFWDNAYAVHDLTETGDNLLDPFAELKKRGRENMIYMFASTSKITFAGGGVSAICAGEENIEYIRKHIFVQTIGPDKINQMRHVKFLRDMDGIREIMAKHREIIKPKFDMVQKVLSESFEEGGEVEWTKPNGGYFVSLNTPAGCAKRTVELAAEAGAALTPAGSAFPYKKDSEDKNIRISPTFPSVAELETAMRILAVCVKLAVKEKEESV